ncbi:MAG: hypothetical protein ABIQ06_13965 [Caldimonas sp.]
MSARAEALAALRAQQEQARERLGVRAPVARGDVLQAALRHAGRREGDSVIEDTWVYSPPGLRYPAATEPVRWARTREILQRSSPGPDEDGVYLEMIARQAASIEVILRREHSGEPDRRMAQICDRLLLGTLPSMNPAAYARSHGDFHFVQIAAGLIDYAYQCAKAVVLSWKPVPPAPGGRFGFKGEAQDVEEMLAADPAPLRQLRRTLENYLFEGRPRPEDSEAPAENYQAPLLLLTNFNERFIIAHEYAHTLYEALDLVIREGGPSAEEFAADVHAFHLVAESGHVLDLVPPNMSTQGAFFVLTALDVVQRALALAGPVGASAGPVAGHGLAAQRLAVLRECYLRTVSSEDGDLSIRPALYAANTLELLWQRLLDQGLAADWSGRALNRIWSEAGRPARR